MPGVAREGDPAKVFEQEPEDTMKNTTPPPPDSYDWVGEGKNRKQIPHYNSPPKIEVKEVIKAKGYKPEGKVFSDKKRILTIADTFSDAEINTYDREWPIDEEGHLKGGYKDTQTNHQEQTDITCEEGSASVFINGVPVVRVGDKLSVGCVEKGSERTFSG